MMTYIDHATIAVRDLDSAVARFRDELAFFVSSKRTEPSSASANAVIPLLQGYVELLAMNRPATRSAGSHATPALRSLNAFLTAREGLFDFAILSSHIHEDVESLRARGSRLQPPVCESSEADGQSRRWWTATVPDEEPRILPSLIQYDGEESSRVREAALSQPYAIRSLAEVTVIVPVLDQALVAYKRDFGLDPVRQRGGAAQFQLTASKINLIPAKLAPLGVPIGLYSIGLGTTNINVAKSQISGRGVTQRSDALTWSVSSQIDPATTCGATVNLVQI